jgi:tellurite resistance protein TerC
MDMAYFSAWGIFLAFVLAMLFFDLFVLHRKPHAISMREAAIGALLPVVLAIAFTGAVYWAYNTHFLHLGNPPANIAADDLKYYPRTGTEAAIFFITGYVVELSLSADNVFLFIVLMGFFKVPANLQHRVLFWGIFGALVMRGVMIAAGAALLTRFHWIIYIFGAFLIFTAIKMLMSKEDDPDPSKNLIIRGVRKVVPIHAGFEGKNFFTHIDGKLMGTSLLLVLICIEFTDLVFALDSIPAIFGITRDPFIVFTSNVFAILGLRSMYFLLAGIMDKFHYLKIGLAIVLGFVGIKMVLPGLGDLYGHYTGTTQHWDVDKYISLGVIVLALAGSIVASLIFPSKQHHENPLQNPDTETVA